MPGPAPEAPALRSACPHAGAARPSPEGARRRGRQPRGRQAGERGLPEVRDRPERKPRAAGPEDRGPRLSHHGDPDKGERKRPAHSPRLQTTSDGRRLDARHRQPGRKGVSGTGAQHAREQGHMAALRQRARARPGRLQPLDRRPEDLPCLALGGLRRRRDPDQRRPARSRGTFGHRAVRRGLLRCRAPRPDPALPRAADRDIERGNGLRDRGA